MLHITVLPMNRLSETPTDPTETKIADSVKLSQIPLKLVDSIKLSPIPTEMKIADSVKLTDK